MSASSNMRNGQPPTNNEIKEYVDQILQCADLEKITIKMVYNQVYSHYPDLDLAHKKDFIRATVMSNIRSEPTIAQIEKLVNFLEENPELAKGTDQANNAHENLQKTQKWEDIAKELNLMGGAKRSGISWAKLWDVSRRQINHIIADRKSGNGARGGIIQPFTPEMMERMIILLEGLGIEEIPVESPSALTVNLDPTVAQMEKLVKFLEENPEIATRTNHATNAQESLQTTTPKWEAIANELNLMGGANRSADSWAGLWDVSRSRLNHIIADRKSGTGGASGGPYTPEMMERMIVLLEGLGIEEIPAESPSDDEIKKYVKQILEGANLEQITMKMVCQQVYDHYPDFDLAHKKDFIKATVKSCI